MKACRLLFVLFCGSLLLLPLLERVRIDAPSKKRGDPAAAPLIVE